MSSFGIFLDNAGEQSFGTKFKSCTTKNKMAYKELSLWLDRLHVLGSIPLKFWALVLIGSLAMPLICQSNQCTLRETKKDNKAFQCWKLNNIFLVKSQKGSYINIQREAWLPAVEMLSTSKCSMTSLRKHLQEVNAIAISHKKESF